MDKKDKKIVKLAVIRDDIDNSCPFSISIPQGCMNLGKLVLKLAPLKIIGKNATEEEKQQLTKANNHLFIWNAPGERCLFARAVMESENKVECSFEEDGIGIKDSSALVGSPFFPKTMIGPNLEGSFELPHGHFALTDDLARLNYSGPFSIEGLFADDGDCEEKSGKNK